MASSSLLLLRMPIPRSSIQLGQLVLDPKYPTEDVCRPSLLHVATSPSNNTDDSHTVTTILKDFKQVIDRTRGTRLGVTLASLLSLTPSATSTVSATVSSRQLVAQELADAAGYFRLACGEAPVRAWLEKNLSRSFGNVYLVSGLRTLTDARIDDMQRAETDVGVSVSAPVWLVTAAATGVPLPLPDDVTVLATNAEVTRGNGQSTGYTVPGDYVFAVAYRKVKLSLFSMGDVDEAYVQRGNRWKSTLEFRGQDDQDGVDVDIAGHLDVKDLLSRHESFDLDGEQILCEVEDDFD